MHPIIILTNIVYLQLPTSCYTLHSFAGDVVKLVLKCHGTTKTPVFDVDTYAAGYPGQNNNGSEPGARNLQKSIVS